MLKVVASIPLCHLKYLLLPLVDLVFIFILNLVKLRLVLLREIGALEVATFVEVFKGFLERLASQLFEPLVCHSLANAFILFLSFYIAKLDGVLLIKVT